MSDLQVVVVVAVYVAAGHGMAAIARWLWRRHYRRVGDEADHVALIKAFGREAPR